MLRKIASPALPSAILYREHLISMLKNYLVQESALHRRLLLLYAPAGYGKTTLLADFARHTDIPCCWYFLDHTDTDRVTFLRLLMASIRQRFAHFGKELDSLVAQVITVPADQQGKFYQDVLDALCTAMTEEIAAQFVIILSNYHEVNESQTFTTLMNYLIQHIPDHCHLVVESRTIPDIDFVSFLVHREMYGFSKDALRFSAQEICALARIQGGIALSEAEAEQLAQSFDGWITGILLGTYLGDIQGLGASGRQMSRKNLITYVVNEIFKYIPEAANFLQEISILQQMLPSMCNILLNITDAADRLENLVRQGLFVTCNTLDGQEIYEFHPVLRELLSEQFRHQMPERFFSLHQRAGELWADTQEYDQGMYHALAANAYELVTRIIIEAHHQMLTQGRIETLLSWIDVLPTSILESQPRLLLIRARIAIMLGESVSVLPLLDQTAEALSSAVQPMSLDERSLLLAETGILRSKVLFQIGEYLAAQALCQQVLEQIPVQEITLRAEAYMRLGVCANLLGNPAAGLVHLQKALQTWGPQAVDIQVADIHGALGNTYSLIGNFALADHHLARALDCCEQLHHERGKVDNLIRKGTTKIREGKIAEAEAAYLQALELARGPMAFQRGEAYALMNLGSLYLEQAEYSQALVFTENGLTLARRLADKYLINGILPNLAEIYLMLGDSTSAIQLLSEMDIIPPSHDNTASYAFIQHELTHGLIYLLQGQYEKALDHLTGIEASLNSARLSRQQIQAKLRLAACHLARDQQEVALRYINSLATILHTYKGHKRLMLLELQGLPVLLNAVQTLPAMASLRDLLGLGDSTPVQVRVEPPPVSNPVLAVSGQAKLTLFAFGKPTVLIDDKPVTKWRMARARELCFLLLNAEGPLSKDEIITALWEEEISDSIDQTLYLIIHYLRKILGNPCIVSRGQSYQLDLASSYGGSLWYDVNVFQEYYKKAQFALKQEDDVVAREALLAMVGLYRGDYVQPFYSNWCLPRRDELRAAYLEARRLLAQIAWRQEQLEESVEHWQRILAMDDYLEEVHYELMRCYLRQDKRGLALRQYQRCEEILQREFGIKPGPNIQNLYQQIISDKTRKTNTQLS